MERFLHLIRRRIPASAWVALGVVGAAAALLWWSPFKEPISTVPVEQSPAWPEVEGGPLTGPDRDPLPPGALLRLGRERLRQGGGSALLAFSPDGNILASVEPPRLEWPGKHVIHLWQVATGKEVRRLESPAQSSISNILFSADGKRLSLLGYQFSREENRIGNWIFCILDVDTGKEVRPLKGPREPWVRGVRSPDGKMLAVRDKATIRLWDLSTDQEVRQLATRGDEQPVGFTDGGKTLIGLSSQQNTVHFWDVTTGAELQQLLLSSTRHFDRIILSADGKVMLALEWSGPIRCWDVIARREARQLDNPYPGFTAVGLSPDGRTAAAGYIDGTICWWDTATGQKSHEVRAHPNGVGALTFSGNGKVLASQQARDDGAIQLWDVATGDKLSPREGHQAGVVSLSIAPDDRTVATVGEDHTLRIWSATTGEELRRFRTIGRSVAFSPDGMTLAASGDGENGDRPGTVWLLDPPTGKKLRRFAGDHAPFAMLAFSADGSKLAGGGEDNCLWEVATGKVLREFPGSKFRPAAFSNAAPILAVGRGDTIELWDLVSDQLLRRLGPARKPTDYWRSFLADYPSARFVASSLAFSPDGKLLAAADGIELGPPPLPRDGVIRVYELATGQERLVLQGHRQLFTSTRFSPDGKALVSGGEDGSVRLWEVASGKELRRFRGHRDMVTCVAFAPDGRTVISGSRDSTALVWNVAPPRP